VQNLSATAGSRARGITGDDDGDEGVFDIALIAKGAARRQTEYFLILSLGKSEFHHFNACSFPPSTQEGVLIVSLLPEMIGRQVFQLLGVSAS